ncbi:flavin-containing monooxygenase [Microvirga pudoricolor]|uniref:flavin-containing monooxygenase n=1 Tax=Microvirga pudoricolor TaxID=2778729 RepID=UPI00195198E0|nr:NAD(P)/FAD-dependent oxidoreductase [Microvirga pudoricolor]MBM6594860.1 NAD(P)/FAD-dependent oxidoreductase [Microvirga pudoricolor]
MNLQYASFRTRLEASLAGADMRVLLMVLVHMTGNLRWLESPYRPKRDVSLIPDPSAGLPVSIQDEIRHAVADVFSPPFPRPVISDPGNDLMRRMMSTCLGETVPDEYAPLIREEMNLISRLPEWKSGRPEAASSTHVLIVGAGVCGIALAVGLKNAGIPYTIIEKRPDVGGTWSTNRYPGCGVDTPNHSYSFSFAQKNPWTRYFSQREEIHDYLRRVADDFAILPNIRLETEFLSSSWDEKAGCWISFIRSGGEIERVESRILITAIGQLSEPSTPKIEGAEDFQGQLFHSANWPDDLSVDGKRIAVIGTGATAMQLVPTVADRVASITVYQRTPQWARPIAGYADPISEANRWLLEKLPFYAEWFRFNMFWRYGDGLLPLLRKDASWTNPDRSVNRANDRHREEMIAFIRSELADRPDLVEKCIPDYPPYGKRILLDNGWYRALMKRSVDLVTTPIDHITSDGIVTNDGVSRPADVIVYSTGFRVDEMAGRLDIRGRDGVPLRDAWKQQNPTAYLGLTVPGFPNFFCMLGPNSGPGHGGSVIFQAECQTRYIASSLLQMIENDIGAMEVRQDVHDAYVKSVDDEHEQLIWTHPGMSTYYRNGLGRVFSVMPWRFVDYWAMTHDPNLEDYHVRRA